MTTTQPLLTRAFVCLTGGHFLQALGFSSMPLLPIYLGYLGASRSEIGAVMACASVGGLLSRPAVGWALDSWGRKPTLILGTVLMALVMQLTVFITSVGPLVVGMRFGFGIAEGILFTGYFAFAADLVPASRRTEGLALFGISGLLPLAVNPLVGQLGFGPSELRWFFPILGWVVACSLLFVIPLSEPKNTHGRPRITWQVVRSGLGVPSLWSVWLASVVFATLVSTYMAFSTITAESRGIENGALLWLAYGAGAVGVRLVGARLPDRVGPENLVAPAVLFYVVALLVAARAESLGGMLVSGGFAGVGHGYCFPVIASLVVSRSPVEIRGSAMAAFTALWELAAISFTPVFGVLADLHGDGVMFITASCLAVVGVAGWGILERRFGRMTR